MNGISARMAARSPRVAAVAVWPVSSRPVVDGKKSDSIPPFYLQCSHTRIHVARGVARQVSQPVVAASSAHDCDPMPTSLRLVRLTKTVLLGVMAVSAFAGIGSPAHGPSMFASLSIALPAVSADAMAAAFRSAWAGLAAGCLHTLAGADHLAALTPLTIGQSHLRASMLGALWGFGHSTGQLMLGLLMVVLKDRFQQLVPALSKWGGTTVGLTLLAIGVLGVYESFFEGEHDHAHENELADDGKKNKGFGLATFATGIIYGLQPDALFVIIPALALPTKLAAIAYILMFVLGTVAAMGAYAGVIGATSQAIKKTSTKLTTNLSGAASAMAILIGLGVLLSGWGINTPFAIA